MSAEDFRPATASRVESHVRAIATAYAEDEASARAEFGGEFRRDIETFVSHEAIAACVVPERCELSPVPGLRYCAFVDPRAGLRIR